VSNWGTIEGVLSVLDVAVREGFWFEISPEDSKILLEYIQSLGGAK